jgi:hypothetical protein
MSCIRKLLSSVLLCVFCGGSAGAEGFILGLGAAADTEDGIAISAFGDFGIGENTWLSGTIGSTETEALTGGFSTTFYDVGIDHYFNPVGIRLSGAYWGDPDLLDSDDVRASFYYRDEIASFSADYERRNFDFIFGSILLDERRKAEFHADGWGMTNRIGIGDNFAIRLSGMHYEFSRNIRVQRDIDVLRFLSASRLSLMNSLIDYRINAGVEYRFGLRSVDLSVGTWKTAVDQSKVDSYTVGFLTPMTDRTDIEFRLSFDDSETFGNTTALTVYLYYFGGS